MWELIEEAFAPYVDPTLENRVARAASKWQRQAETALDLQTDSGAIARLQVEAESPRQQAEQINDELATATEDVVLPEVEVPQSRVDLESLVSRHQVRHQLAHRHKDPDCPQAVSRRYRRRVSGAER